MARKDVARLLGLHSIPDTQAGRKEINRKLRRAAFGAQCHHCHGIKGTALHAFFCPGYIPATAPVSAAAWGAMTRSRRESNMRPYTRNFFDLSMQQQTELRRTAAEEHLCRVGVTLEDAGLAGQPTGPEGEAVDPIFVADHKHQFPILIALRYMVPMTADGRPQEPWILSAQAAMA